jgi:predicted permease
VPGVRDAALASPALLSGNTTTGGVYVEGRTYSVGERSEQMHRVVVSPGFFAMMEIPLLLGRDLEDRDRDGTPRVAVVNEAAVRKFFPGGSPLGRRFGPSPEHSADIEVVGIVRDAKYDSVSDAAPPTMYVPFQQTMPGTATIQVRTAVAPLSVVAAIREGIRQIDANMPIIDVTTQDEQIERRFAQTRVFARAYAMFGALALLIASIGLFGVVSYAVTSRTSEIGIRMALGARSIDVLGMVMRESLTIVAIGVAAGLAASIAAGRLVASMLYGVEPRDIRSIALAALAMTVVAAIAAYIPARRAARVDPMVALRCE